MLPRRRGLSMFFLLCSSRDNKKVELHPRGILSYGMNNMSSSCSLHIMWRMILKYLPAMDSSVVVASRAILRHVIVFMPQEPSLCDKFPLHLLTVLICDDERIVGFNVPRTQWLNLWKNIEGDNMMTMMMMVQLTPINHMTVAKVMPRHELWTGKQRRRDT